MSVNSAINQGYLAEVDALSQLLTRFLQRRSGAPTQERKALIEAEAVVLFERLLALDYKLQAIQAGDYPDYEEYREFYDMYLHLASVNTNKLKKLTELFVQHFNSQQYALTDLLGRLKRIRQKRSALALWNNKDAKFVLSEHFLNLDALDNKFSSSETCHVDTSQGVLTLPVRSQVPLTIRSVVIGSGSNGQVGNSDEEVTTNNISPEYAINGNSNDWFEYERMDSGPLQLSLIVELGKVDIVNNIVVTPLNLGQAYNYEIENIIFSTDGQAVELSDLTGPLEDDKMTVKSAGNDSEWSLTFLPVYAKTITIKFKQSHNYQIKVGSSNGAATNRNRYAVGITKLAVNQIKYSGTGSINSTERNLSGGLHLCVPVVDVWPPQPELFDAMMEVSFNGGESWVSADNVDDGVGSSVLMEGLEQSMIWRLAMSRDSAALDNATSFIPVQSGIREVAHLQKSVSRFKSPSVLALPQRPMRSDIFVLQPKIARRGDRFKRLLIGTGTGTTSRFELPFSPVDSGLEPDSMHVYVNGYEYAYQQDDSVLASEEWSFSNDFKEIFFTDDVSNGAKITVVFDEERMLFEERSDGYYHQMGMLFDPDEKNIDITFHPRAAARKTLQLPRNKKVIKLNVKNIEDDSFMLTSSNATSYVAVSSRTDLLTTSNGYLLDAVNGILWLNSEFNADSVRATFAHQNGQQLSSEQFDVVYGEESVRPYGVRIAADAFQAKEATDTVGSALGKRINPITGVYGARISKVGSATDATTLSYDYVVKGTVRASSDMFSRTYVDEDPQEVDFIDGKTEFLGLVAMNTESTTAVTLSASETTASFRLAAGALYYEGFEVLFGNTTVFATDVGSSTPVATGQYSIDEEGQVLVFVGSGGTLEGGISIVYYYEDPEAEARNKFSVDYREGIFYGGSELQAGATVKYKASSHKVAYNVANEIDRYSYDSQTNSVSVRTEGLKSINSLVKIIWAKPSADQSLRALRDYFSPIMSLLAFRYT